MFFRSLTGNENLVEIQGTLQNCREHVHEWAKTNRVSSYPSKNHLVARHPIGNHGAAFKILGLVVDPDLAMDSTIDSLLTKIR
jgi:hypothetical protein